MEIIKEEHQKLVRCGLDGVQTFHTLYHCRIAPLAERSRPMWRYSVQVPAAPSEGAGVHRGLMPTGPGRTF